MKNIKVQFVKLKASDEKALVRVTFDTNGLYIINGKEVKLDYGQKISFNEIPKIQDVTLKQEHVGYDTTEGFMSKEDFINLNNRLKEDGYDNNREIWTDLDKEYNFKKTLSNLKPEAKIITDKIITDLEIKETNIFVLDTEDKFIKSDYFFGKDTPMCVFQANEFLREVFLKKCHELKLEEAENKLGNTYHAPTHSGVRFAKISAKYIFDDSFEYKGTVRDTFENILLLKTELEKKVNDRVEQTFRLMNDKKRINDEDLLRDIKNILNEVNKIAPKVGTRSNLESAKRQLNVLITKF